MDIYFLDLNNISKTVLDEFINKCAENNSFSNELKKRQHFAGKFILKYVLEKEFGIKNYEIETVNGKPFLKDLPYYYSISHSQNMVGLAIGDKMVGFDIEYNKRERDYGAISARYGQKINTQKEFYDFWTQHEAKIKLGGDFKNVVCLTGIMDNDFTYTLACKEPFVIYNVSTINL
ncbi:MAG: hypothetical protein K6A44_06895 [bacterium]|nr:hypothetical protein [bacterium]